MLCGVPLLVHTDVTHTHTLTLTLTHTHSHKLTHTHSHQDIRYGTMPTGLDVKSHHAAATPAEDSFCIQYGTDFMTWSFLNVLSFSKVRA
jgi:hypothetical protein